MLYQAFVFTYAAFFTCVCLVVGWPLFDRQEKASTSFFREDNPGKFDDLSNSQTFEQEKELYIVKSIVQRRTSSDLLIVLSLSFHHGASRTKLQTIPT